MFDDTFEGQTNFCPMCEQYARKIIAKDKQIAKLENKLKKLEVLTKVKKGWDKNFLVLNGKFESPK